MSENIVETHEPECSHVKHFCATNYLNSLVLFPPVTVSARWNMEKRGVQSMGCEENEVLNWECSA